MCLNECAAAEFVKIMGKDLDVMKQDEVDGGNDEDEI